MAHRKEVFDASGHEVTIQQVNEGGAISAWIDGYAAHTWKAAESGEMPNDIVEKAKSESEWSGFETILSWMVDNDKYYCNSCNSLYNSDNVVRKHFAGHICGECNAEAKHCPDNPDGNSHEDECLNPRQKHNARVSTKYKCVHCGRKRKTTPTG